jgi:enoyl-CoA hydratase/carnithine racemase
MTTSGFTTISLKTDGPTAHLQLARGADNLINHTMIGELAAALTGLADESGLRVLVLRGSATAFCAGVDWTALTGDHGQDVHAFRKLEQVATALERLHLATVAVVEGRCAGAGLDLALACDCRIGTAGCSVELSDVRSGRLPSMLPYRLPKYTGLGVARRMLLAGRSCSGSEAVAAGLLDEVFPADGLEDGLNGLIDTLTRADPVAIAMGRRLLLEAYSTTAEEAVGNFLAAQDRCLSLPADRRPHQPV